MKPTSRLRMRARSASERSTTNSPFSQYSPSVGVSSNPRIESRVDLPQPDGPAIETYSPALISNQPMIMRAFQLLPCRKFAGLQSLHDLHGADGTAPELYQDARGHLPILVQLEYFDSALRLSETGPADVDHIIQMFQF